MINKLEQEKSQNERDSYQDTDSEMMNKLDQTTERVMAYSKSHKMDTLAFVVLVIGFFVAMIEPSVGASIVGAIIGIYFGGELLEFLTSLNERIRRVGMFRHLIMGVALLTLFIAQPYFFIALAAVIGVRALMK